LLKFIIYQTNNYNMKLPFTQMGFFHLKCMHMISYWKHVNVLKKKITNKRRSQVHVHEPQAKYLTTSLL